MSADDAVWQKIRSKLAELGASKMHVNVGVLGTGAEDGGTSLIEVALIHEYGAPRANIPQRSFLRFTARERSADLNKVILTVCKGILADRLSPTQALDQMGLWFSNAVKASIRKKLIYQNLAPRTIARKGSDTALVDTGRLLNAITWKVVT